jgi:hypothetical protein
MNVEARAWRLADPRNALQKITAIQDGGIILEEVPVERALSPPSEDNVTVIALPAGSAASEDDRKALEHWVSTHAAGGWSPIDLSMRARIIWTPERIAVIGTPDAVEDACMASVLVALIAQQTARLERELAELWPNLKSHAALTHSVSRVDLARQPEVDRLTRRGWQLRADHAALERKLGQAHGMSAAGRRIFRELVVQGGLQDRIESLEPGIETVQDLYELATDRLTEFRYFRSEYIMEGLILLVLLLELVSLSREFFVR